MLPVFRIITVCGSFYPLVFCKGSSSSVPCGCVRACLSLPAPCIWTAANSTLFPLQCPSLDDKLYSHCTIRKLLRKLDNLLYLSRMEVKSLGRRSLWLGLEFLILEGVSPGCFGEQSLSHGGAFSSKPVLLLTKLLQTLCSNADQFMMYLKKKKSDHSSEWFSVGSFPF